MPEKCDFIGEMCGGRGAGGFRKLFRHPKEKIVGLGGGGLQNQHMTSSTQQFNDLCNLAISRGLQT